MRKRQKTNREEINLTQNDIIEKPPGAPINYVPPKPSEILSKLSSIRSENFEITQVNTIGDGIANKGIELNEIPTVQKIDNSNKLDILSRLKAISKGETLPVPKALPKATIFNKIGVETEDNNNTKTTETKKEVETVVQYDKPIGFGIGPALEFISRNGILVEHQGDEEQILEYRDSNGNLINGKAAFKYQSHIFSGKAPGLKYRKKRLEKIKAEEKKKIFQIGDTPLHSASSLRTTLEERKQPFIELSGSQRNVLPYEPSQEDIKDTSQRKKRLKLRNKQKLKKEVHIKVLK